MISNTKIPFTLPVAFHPGVFLAEKLEELNMSNKEFAVKTGKPEKTITAILKGNSSITPDMAVTFENVLGIPAQMWLNYQRIYDEFKARERKEELLRSDIPWMKKFPVNEMIKRGWLPEATTPEEKTSALLKFFGVASTEAWKNYYINAKVKTSFGISLSKSPEPEALSLWLRKGELDAYEIQAYEYSQSKLRSVLPAVKSLIAKCPEDLFVKLQDLLSTAGVKFVTTPLLPKVQVNGVTRWVGGDTPLIQIPEGNGQFQSVIFRSIGNILIYGKKDFFIDGAGFSVSDHSKGKTVETFVQKWLSTAPTPGIVTKGKQPQQSRLIPISTP